jgi:hypothetical protein
MWDLQNIKMKIPVGVLAFFLAAAVVLGALAMTLTHRWQSKRLCFYILNWVSLLGMVCLNLI